MIAETNTRHSFSLLGLTALRLGVGIVMMFHGWDKLQGMQGWQQNVASMGIPFPEVSGWLAAIAEFGGGLALALGLLTPVAASGILIVMLTAIFTVHWGNGLMAANNGFELPLLIALIASFFLVRGAGPWSLDAAFHRFRTDRAQRRVPGGMPRTGGPTLSPTGG